MSDIRIDPARQDYVQDGSQYAVCDDLGNRVYLLLSIERGSLLGDAGVGSLLHLLMRAKAGPDTLRLAQDYAMDALQPLIADGTALSVQATAAWRTPGVGILLTIVVEQASGRSIFTHYVPVG